MSELLLVYQYMYVHVSLQWLPSIIIICLPVCIVGVCVINFILGVVHIADVAI